MQPYRKPREKTYRHKVVMASDWFEAEREMQKLGPRGFKVASVTIDDTLEYRIAIVMTRRTSGD